MSNLNSTFTLTNVNALIIHYDYPIEHAMVGHQKHDELINAYLPIMVPLTDLLNDRGLLGDLEETLDKINNKRRTFFQTYNVWPDITFYHQYRGNYPVDIDTLVTHLVPKLQLWFPVRFLGLSTTIHMYQNHEHVTLIRKYHDLSMSGDLIKQVTELKAFPQHDHEVIVAVDPLLLSDAKFFKEHHDGVAFIPVQQGQVYPHPHVTFDPVFQTVTYFEENKSFSWSIQ